MTRVHAEEKIGKQALLHNLYTSSLFQHFQDMKLMNVITTQIHHQYILKHLMNIIPCASNIFFPLPIWYGGMWR